jgi:hypothetical protein
MKRNLSGALAPKGMDLKNPEGAGLISFGLIQHSGKSSLWEFDEPQSRFEI